MESSCSETSSVAAALDEVMSQPHLEFSLCTNSGIVIEGVSTRRQWRRRSLQRRATSRQRRRAAWQQVSKPISKHSRRLRAGAGGSLGLAQAAS